VVKKQNQVTHGRALSSKTLVGNICSNTQERMQLLVKIERSPKISSAID
jgi:hypothetical protein